MARKRKDPFRCYALAGRVAAVGLTAVFGMLVMKILAGHAPGIEDDTRKEYRI